MLHNKWIHASSRADRLPEIDMLCLIVSLRQFCLHLSWKQPTSDPRKEEATNRFHRFGESRDMRSEEHTSELQSPDHLVCRLLLEKKKHNTILTDLTPT